LYRGVVLPIVMEHHAPTQAVGPSLFGAAGRGLVECCQDLLFAATTRGRGTELLRPVANRRCHPAQSNR
jgi:hypothetical protein